MVRVASLTSSDLNSGFTSSSIRLETLAHLRGLGITEEVALPGFPCESKVRSLREVVSRCLAMFVTVAVAFDFDRERARYWLSQFALEQSLSESEREFISSPKADPTNFRAKVESLLAVSWSLNLVQNIPANQLCPNNFVSTFPNLKLNEGPDLLIRKCYIRPLAEILRQADLYYCLHWYVRELRFGLLHGRAPLPEYVIVERRRSFEWVLSGEDWDSVRLDT